VTWTKKIRERGGGVRSEVRVGVRTLASGRRFVEITVGAPLAMECGYILGERVDVLVGADTHAGRLRFVRATHGEYTWARNGSGRNVARKVSIALDLPRAP